MRAMRETASSTDGAYESLPLGTLAQRWEELHSAAAQLAKVADLAPERFEGRLAAFPDLLGEANEWQRELAWQGVEDIDAMMRPGLTALGTLEQRGSDVTAPAIALWREFYCAREAVLFAVEPRSQVSD